MKLTKPLIICGLIALSANLFAAELGNKLEKTARTFGAAAVQKNLTGTVLAVFPFQTDEKLAKKRVDFAVSELLAHSLLKQGSFKIVERAQLEEVMKEQKLGLSGAVDSKTASGIGKLLGARTLVLGNVIKMGNSYQITSKLIDAETSEMLASEIIEVPISTFDEEAARYLVLVPEREALGIYAGLSAWPIKATANHPTDMTNVPGVKLTPKAKSDLTHAFTLGIRYQMAQHWMLDIAYAPDMSLGRIVSFSINGTGSRVVNIGGTGSRLSINRTDNLSAKWRTIYGLGYQAYSLLYSENGNILQVGSTSTVLHYPEHGTTIFSAFARGGLELRIKERIGWSLTGLLMQQNTFPFTMQSVINGVADKKVNVMSVKTPLFSVDTTFAFYF